MKTFLENMKEAVSHLDKARSIFAQGPLDWYLEKLVEHSEALLTKFAPIKVGERAKIVAEIKCEDGWRGCEKTLAIGQAGEIVEVDYRKGKFHYEFFPDREWWLDSKGEYREIESRHRFTLAEDVLAKEDEIDIDLTEILGTPEQRIEIASNFAIKMMRERDALRQKLQELERNK